MKITGTKGYIDIEHNGKTARFSGDMCIDGFAAIASTMKWISLNERFPVTEQERLDLMRAVREEVKNNQYKVFFTDDKYGDLEF